MSVMDAIEGAGQELAVVMPVFNEEACISEVVESWHDALSRNQIDFRMIVLNDGSRDGTGLLLDRLQHLSGIEVIHKENSGHGPTILMGYRRAVRLAPWVFQTDSDGEMAAAHFAEFWRRREDFDALIGIRGDRRQSLSRRLTSLGSRMTIRFLFGAGVRDVNIPYRLIRSSCLSSILRGIPPAAVTPNILISGALARSSWRVLNQTVPCEGRTTGEPSVRSWKLAAAVWRSLWQAIQFRLRSR